VAIPTTTTHPAKTPTIQERIIHPAIFQKEPGITDKKVNTVKPKAIENETVILKALEKDM
jgi:hypothetical protein